MSKKTIWLLSFALALGLISTGYGDVVYDFETGAQGWGGLKDGTAPTVSPETHSDGGSQSLCVTIDEAAHEQQEAGWASPRDFTADQAAGGLSTLSFWYRVDDPDFDGGNFVCHWISSTEAWSGGGWYGNGLYGVVIADGQWHQQTADLSILGEAAGGWQGTWGDLAAWDFRDDLFYSFEIAVSPTDNTTGSNLYIDDVQLLGSSAPPPASVVVSDFEGDLNGWYTDTWTAGTISLSTTGATTGAQAMQVEGPGGWQQMTKVDAKPHMAALGTRGVKITVDVTAFEADMTTTWMQVGMVINCQNNDDNGANNNLGWNDLGTQDIARDGQPHTLTWLIPDEVADKIAVADDTIGWFELLLISNADEASVVKFYIDNVQIAGIPLPAGKSSDFIIGNWEQDLDNWVVGGNADVRYSDTNGVTLDDYSLDVYTPTGEWNTDVLMLNLLDPNQAAVLEAFKTNTKISVDVTRLVVDWPTDDIPGWNEILMVINAGGDGWSTWQLLGKLAGWRQTDGDRTITATWGYAPYLSQIDFDNLTWCELRLGINANDPDYGGWVWFYIDNMRLSGGGIPLNPQPANGAKDVNVETLLSWSGGMFAASHNLYLGTSRSAVAAADGNDTPDVLFVGLDGTSFDPNSLDFNTEYFWRIDAVNDVNPDSPWAGAVWAFTTGNFLVVDDFESYTNESPNRLFQTWVDGWGYSEDDFLPEGDPGNGTGMAVGHDIWTQGTPYTTVVETEIVHGGSQSMPLYYDNADTGISEAERTWAEPQDWTINGFNALKLFVQGKEDNGADRLYVKVEDSVGNVATVPYSDTSIVTTAQWTEWVIPHGDLTAADVNMASVAKMTIGVGDQGNPTQAAGLLYVDDIRIGFQAIGLVAYYALEDNTDDSSGNEHHGVLTGDPNFAVSYVAGPAGLGTAMLFDGANGHEYVDLGTFNPSEKTDQLSLALWAKWDGPSDSWQAFMGKRHTGDWDREIMMWYFELERDVWDVRFAREGSSVNTGQTLQVDQWTHLAVTFDGTTAKVYINGEVVDEGNFSFGEDKEAPMQIGAATNGGGNPFNGALDEVRIYDIVLSEAEILELAGK